jgi:hypothetical protein
MKLRLHFLFPVLLLAVVAGGFILLHKSRRTDGLGPRASVRGEHSSDLPPGKMETAPLPTREKSRSSGDGKSPVSGLVDRLLATRRPTEFGRVAEELSSAPLAPEELERLRAIARGGGSSHHRLIAIQVLAKLEDPEGKNFAALRDAIGANEEIVSHSALSSLRTYLQSNPSFASEVNGFLLDRAGSSGDEEFRQLAVTAIDVDTLKESEYRIFTGLLNDGSEEVRCAVIHTLIRTTRREQAFQTLANSFATDPSERVKTHILSVLVEMGREARATLVSLKGIFRDLDPEIDEALQNLDSPE